MLWLLMLALLSSSIAKAQRSQLTANVTYNTIGLAHVEVINSVSKKISVTDNAGKFTIEVAPGETLVFVADSYELKKLTISSATFKDKNLSIELFKKASELNEVVVENIKIEHIGADADFSNQLNMQKQQLSSGIYNVGASAIPNGLDIISIFSKVAQLFRGKQDDTAKSKTSPTFRKVADSLFDENYFTNNLKLKANELSLFFEYCQADPDSNVILQDVNQLAMMDFLEKKVIQFRNLPK